MSEGTIWDSPNQQVVRADGSAPWDEGTGGAILKTAEEEAAAEAAAELASEPGLNEMTKAQLLAYAQGLGVSPANNDMTKDEIRAGVDAKLAEGAG
jgi:hypothetical protein